MLPSTCAIAGRCCSTAAARHPADCPPGPGCPRPGFAPGEPGVELDQDASSGPKQTMTLGEQAHGILGIQVVQNVAEQNGVKGIRRPLLQGLHPAHQQREWLQSRPSEAEPGVGDACGGEVHANQFFCPPQGTIQEQHAVAAAEVQNPACAWQSQSSPWFSPGVSVSACRGGMGSSSAKTWFQ